MVGLTIRLFTDEDVDARVAPALRQRGYDAVSCLEAGRANQDISDHDQLAYAAEQGRAILIYNVRHYVPLDQAWKAAGWEHAGIIASAQLRDLGELLRRVERHLKTHDSQEQYNQLLWLAE